MLSTRIPSARGTSSTDFADSVKIVGDKPLGVGLTAEVWRAQVWSSGEANSDESNSKVADSLPEKQDVAAKIFKHRADACEPSASSMPAGLEREAELLAEVQGHPNVLRFYGLFRLSGEEAPGPASEAFAPVPRWCLATELCGGADLYDSLARRRFQEPDAKKIMTGIFGALAHLHGRGVLHRDVKVENVMLRDDGSPVLADFGLSCRMSDVEAVMSRCGSPGYIPPEVLLKQGWLEESDVFSAGVMLYLLLSRKQPFQGRDVMETLENTVQGKWSFSKHERFSRVSPECKAVVRRLLSRTPDHRPLADETLQEAWFVEDATQLPNHLGKNDSRRSVSVSSNLEMPQAAGSVASAALPSFVMSSVPSREAVPYHDDEQSCCRASDMEIEALNSCSSAGPASWMYSKGLKVRRAASMLKPQPPKANVMEKLRAPLKLRSLFPGSRRASSVVPQPAGAGSFSSSAPTAAGRSSSSASGFSSVLSSEEFDIDRAVGDVHQGDDIDQEISEVATSILRDRAAVPQNKLRSYRLPALWSSNV